MKLVKLFLSLLFVLCISVSSQFGTVNASSIIPTTKVLLLDTMPNSSLGARAKAYLSAPFKFPFYEVVQDEGLPYHANPTLVEMRDLAFRTGADLVILPVIDKWYYGEARRTPLFSFLFDDYDSETYIVARTKISLYSYNAKTDEFRQDSASYNRTQELFMAPSEEELLQNLTDKILQELPYKRVPKDSTNK